MKRSVGKATGPAWFAKSSWAGGVDVNVHPADTNMHVDAAAMPTPTVHSLQRIKFFRQSRIGDRWPVVMVEAGSLLDLLL